MRRTFAVVVGLAASVAAVALELRESGPSLDSVRAAAQRSLAARAADISLTVTAAGAPTFRAKGSVTMASGETHLRASGIETVISGRGMRVRTAGHAGDDEWVELPRAGGQPFDDVVGVLEAIAAGAADGATVDVDVDVDVGAGGRVTRLSLSSADGHVVLLLGPYRE